MGVFDMSGNVFEWTSSQVSSYHYDVVADTLEGEIARVVRGGSWFGDQKDARAAARFIGTPDYRDFDFGYRVVVRRFPSH